MFFVEKFENATIFRPHVEERFRETQAIIVMD